MPVSLFEPALTRIYNAANGVKTLEAQVLELAGFAGWLGSAVLVLLLGRTVGGAQKYMINYLLDRVTPEEIPVRIPQTENGVN